MAGVSCKAGTEAIVGLSNPSYNREGFRILFPGAAASGPSPSNPAFPSPGSLLWGVTFCSILTTGNRRCPQPRKVRVASVPLTFQSSITREVKGGVGGRCPRPSRQQPPPPGRHECSLLRCFSENSRQLGALRRRRTARKWRRPQLRRASEGGRTLQTPGQSPIPDTVVNIARCWSARIPSSCQDRPARTRSRFDLGWRRMNTKSGLGSRRLHL